MFHHNLLPHPLILSLKSELLDSAGVVLGAIIPILRARSWIQFRDP